MNDRKPELFLLLGAWISFVSFFIAGTAFLPSRSLSAESNQALLYRLASSERVDTPSVPSEGKRIVADLGAMTITLHDRDLPPRTFPILSKGREGTFWETPTGVYEVGARSERHFSSIGETWMPYSLQFYGNFFIHGWPTYPDGTPVPKGYSGGCIRLDTDDAREVFLFAGPRTPVIVTGGVSVHQFATSSQYYPHSPEGVNPETLPDILAPSFLVADADSREILWERGSEAIVPAGPATSIVTALTALETVNQYKWVRMGELLLGHSALRSDETSAPDEIAVGALIYPLLFDANDTAARAFASDHGERNFVRAMNQKATAIGMEDSVFASPLPRVHATSSTRDLFTLLSYTRTAKRFVIDVTRTERRTFTGADPETSFSWDNKNPWLRAKDASYRGGVGTLNADGSGSAYLLFSLPVSEFETRTVAFIVPESPDIMSDIEGLRDAVQGNFVYGIERKEKTTLLRTESLSAPAPTLLERIRDLFEIKSLLERNVEYQREV